MKGVNCMSKVKCRDYNACNRSCENCDILTNKGCDKEFDFETPKKFVPVERRDHFSTSWNECPTCRNSIGFRPEIKDFRCDRCGQRISWK